MSYIQICDAYKSPIYADNYTSILVERPQDRCQVAFHDAKRYDLCQNCYSKVRKVINGDVCQRYNLGRIKDLTGQKFGRLTVIRDSGLRASNGSVK